MAPSSYMRKSLLPLVVFALAVLSLPGGVDTRPCDEHSTLASSSYPVYSKPYTPSYTRSHTRSHHHSSPVTKTKTVTATRTMTTTDTDTVTRTRTTASVQWSSPVSSARPQTYSAWTSSSSATSSYPSPSASSGGQCDTGPIQCCDSVQSASSMGSGSLLDTLGIDLEDMSTPVGLTCSPLNVLGLGGGGNCAGTTVCCNDNSYNGLINIGCVPIIIQL